MRFLELDLAAYGPFSDVKLDLSQGSEGLHVIYGPNEAGKSSALRALHAALFGVPHATVDNFRHDYKQLRVGGLVRNAAGDELRFVRRKGNKETLLNPDHAQGAAYPPGTLEAFLGGIDGETYARIYGIGHAELIHGGQQMKTLRGLAGESLFAAGLGGAHLAEVMAELENEAKELYTKRSSAIRTAQKDYREALAAKREAEVPTSRWQNLQKDLAAAQQERDDLIERLKQRRVEESRLQRLRNALKWITERRELQDQLAQRAQVRVLPAAYSTADRAEAQRELQHALRQAERLRQELDGPDGIRAQLAQIEIPEVLLERDAHITRLQEDLGAHRKAYRDRADKLQQERNAAAAEVRGILADLGLDVAWEQVETLRLPRDRRVAIQNLAGDARRLRELSNELARQLDAARLDQQEAEAELKKLGPHRDVSGLRRALDRAARAGDLSERIQQASQIVRSLEIEVNRRLAALTLWDGTLEQLAELSPPLAETIDRYEQDFAEQAEKGRALSRELAELNNKVSVARQEAVALSQSGDVPTLEQLDDLRARRDAGWKLVRDSLDGAADEKAIRKFAGTASLPDAYEEATADADEMADRLRREASRVAELEQCRARVSALKERLAQTAGQQVNHGQYQARLEQLWAAVWHPLGIVKPLPPREMRAWLSRLDELRQTAEDLAAKQGELTALEQQRAEHARRITSQAAMVGEGLADEADFDALIEQADEAVDRLEGESQRRATLEERISASRREAGRLESESKRAAQDLAAWQERWEQAMQQLGCAADTSPEQANERLVSLDELFRRVDRINGLDARIHDMDQDAAAFEAEVRSLAEQIAPDLVDDDPAEAAETMRQRRDQARQQNVRREELQKQQSERVERLREAESQADRMQARLDELCRLAEVTDHGELEKVEAASEEVTTRQQRLAEVEAELRNLGDGLSPDELAAEAAEANADELVARLAEVADEIEQLDRARDQAVGKVRDLERQREAADGSSAAAEADERSLGILSRMQSDTEQFLRLRLARELLRQQIEKYRAENQDPLLDRAGDLFARLTCEQFSGLRTEYDAEDRPVIVGVRNDGEPVHVHPGMSDGTRDQLYLALRLAYLERRLTRHEPLPFVVDDILVNFDDQRAAATLDVLAELSRQAQVIFFTHHQHLVELAGAELPSDVLFVHELQGRPAVERTAAAGGRPR